MAYTPSSIVAAVAILASRVRQCDEHRELGGNLAVMEMSQRKVRNATHRPLLDADFAYLVRVAPLVSIDLVIRDHERNVLLGLRANEPAKGYYFVPGGIIRKNEPIRTAFSRILQAEIGQHGLLEDATFIGPYEHFYAENRYHDPAYGTHYVVLAYELRFDCRPQIALDSQHTDIRWMNERDLLATADVHHNTKAYFCER